MANNSQIGNFGYSLVNLVSKQDQLWMNHLQDTLNALKTRTIQVAMLYRTLGEEYYTLPSGLLYDKRIQSWAQGLGHHQFHVSETRALPPMVQSLGHIDDALKDAAATLNPSEIKMLTPTINVQRVEQSLRTAEIWLVDVQWNLDKINNVMDGYREVLETGYNQDKEPPRSEIRRSNAREHWLQVLPTIGIW